MEPGFYYLLAADLLLFGHVLFVAFVVFGLALILVGKVCAWDWVRNTWFRFARDALLDLNHLATSDDPRHTETALKVECLFYSIANAQSLRINRN